MRLVLLIGLTLMTTALVATVPAAATHDSRGACVGHDDTDGDGACNLVDSDDDNDGVKDSCDPNPTNNDDISGWTDWATYKVRGCAGNIDWANLA